MAGIVNYKNTIYKYLDDVKTTIPESITGTGTIETIGTRVIGTGTAFRSEIRKGSWIVDLTQDEIREVDSVESDTVAYIKQAFSADLPALTLLDKISATETSVVAISAQVPSSAAADATMDGEILPKGTSITFSKDSRDGNKSKDFIDPVIIDASGTTVQVLIMK